MQTAGSVEGTINPLLLAAGIDSPAFFGAAIRSAWVFRVGCVGLVLHACFSAHELGFWVYLAAVLN